MIEVKDTNEYCSHGHLKLREYQLRSDKELKMPFPIGGKKNFYKSAEPRQNTTATVVYLTVSTLSTTETFVMILIIIVVVVIKYFFVSSFPKPRIKFLVGRLPYKEDWGHIIFTAFPLM